MRAKKAACLDQTAPGFPVGVGHGVWGREEMALWIQDGDRESLVGIHPENKPNGQ